MIYTNVLRFVFPKLFSFLNNKSGKWLFFLQPKISTVESFYIGLKYFYTYEIQIGLSLIYCDEV